MEPNHSRFCEVEGEQTEKELLFVHSDLSESAACNQVFIIALQDARFFTRWKICDESRRGFPGVWYLSVPGPLQTRGSRPPTFPQAGKMRTCLQSSESAVVRWFQN